MSSFFCEFCGKEIIDTENGYITGCKHYPIEEKSQQLDPKMEVLLMATQESVLKQMKKYTAIEYKIITGNITKLQTMLNQWRHMYEINILQMIQYKQGLAILLTRRRIK